MVICSPPRRLSRDGYAVFVHSRRSVDAGEALASDYLTGEVLLSDGGLNLTSPYFSTYFLVAVS